MRETTLSLLLFGCGMCLLAWRGLAALQVGRDAYRRGVPLARSLSWALVAVVASDRYWWGARLDRLSVAEGRELLVAAAQAQRLLSVVNVRCPLCDHEIKNALSVAAAGELSVRRRAACPHCDFRLDACRQCAHFQPAGGEVTFDRHSGVSRYGDFSHGRCGVYRAAEPVRTAYPQHARRLEAMGYDILPVPKAIVDSYIPLTECTAFSLDLERARRSGLPWIDDRRVALIRLYQRINRSR